MLPKVGRAVAHWVVESVQSVQPGRKERLALSKRSRCLFSVAPAESPYSKILVAYGLKSVSTAASGPAAANNAAATPYPAASLQTNLANPRVWDHQATDCLLRGSMPQSPERMPDCGSRHYRECYPNHLAAAICST